MDVKRIWIGYVRERPVGPMTYWVHLPVNPTERWHEADEYSPPLEVPVSGKGYPVMNVEFNGVAVDPYGQTKAGFELSGKINRKDFGLQWDAVTEAGSIVVSDEVKLILNVQLVKQEVAEAVEA